MKLGNKQLGIARSTSNERLIQTILDESHVRPAVLERRYRVHQLRVAGASQRQIAKQERISKKLVQNDLLAYNASRAKVQAQEDEHIRELLFDRAEIGILALSERVSKGELTAIDRWVKLLDIQMRLYPEKFHRVGAEPGEDTTTVRDSPLTLAQKEKIAAILLREIAMLKQDAIEASSEPRRLPPAESGPRS